MKDLIMLVSIAILAQVHGQIPSSISCISKQCYTAYEIITNFQAAFDVCNQTGGHLMTVQSSASNDAIHDLLTDIKGEFWIGLQFNNAGCTDTASQLRGYEWITGAKLTDFANWRNSETVCAESCVSVSRDLKWTERPCQDSIDGFLCENNYPNLCEALKPKETDQTLRYITPFGNEGEGAISLPPGSLITGNPSGIKYICAPDQGWLQAPWFCEVETGGCAHECVMNGKPQCACPPGQTLQSNKVTCASAPNDPCLKLGCEHICMSSDGSCLCRDGYELREDGKGCRDVDECRDKIICQNSKCVNTIGSYECHCPGGFKKERGVCVDIDECYSSPCEHVCENTKGSYVCSCFDGYIQKIDDHTKCELHCDKEVCPAQCDINIPTQCECPDGFIKDVPKDVALCIDIDECDTNYCSNFCINNFGSYICSCPVGFKLIDGHDCQEDFSEFTTPPMDTVTPTVTTSNSTIDVTSAVTAGGLLGITVCIVLMILIIVFLVHQISKRRSSWKTTSTRRGEDMQDLQQVTTEKYTKKSSFVNRDLKQDT